MIHDKKGKSDETNTADAAISATNVATFIKLILIVTILSALLIASVITLIEARAPIPVHLEPDLILARLANVCLSTTHEPFTIKDQQVIDEKKFVKESIDSCFSVEQLGLFNQVTLQWEKDGFNSKEIVVQKQPTKAISILYVLVQHEDGTRSPGVLSVRK